METVNFRTRTPRGCTPQLWCDEQHPIAWEMEDGKVYIPLRIQGGIACGVCIAQIANLEADVEPAVNMLWGVPCKHEGAL